MFPEAAAAPPASPSTPIIFIIVSLLAVSVCVTVGAARA
eukprot:COSAG03_NODE_432_length_7939_cov_21.783291_2_plen_39_part_00